MMSGFGAFLMLLFWGIGALILFVIIRFAIDSSKTSQKLDDLVQEIHSLRKELKESQNTNTFDKKI